MENYLVGQQGKESYWVFMMLNSLKQDFINVFYLKNQL